jgi:hypothetical protein
VAAGDDVQTVYTEAGEEVDSLNAQADAKARELGLTVCGTDDDNSGESATTSTGTTATAPTTTGGGPVSAEVQTDLQAVRTTLLGVGQALQSATGGSLDEVKKAVPEARSKLAEFDDAIAKLASDTSPNAAQERTRAAVAAAGPKVSDVLGRFFDELEDGDEAGVTALVPEVQRVFTELQTALGS